MTLFATVVYSVVDLVIRQLKTEFRVRDGQT